MVSADTMFSRKPLAQMGVSWLGACWNWARSAGVHLASSQ
jgi:hypothetical protein